jgi:CRISPR-associated protein Csx10
MEAIGIQGAKLVYQNSGLRRVMGWNDLWRLPKPDDLAITMGSVFLFGVTAPLNDDLLDILLNIQNNGLGARRREGFGRVVVASPFHWEVKGQ